MRGNVLGQGSLYRAGAQGKANAENGMNHVVNAKSFCADGSGQEYAVKET